MTEEIYNKATCLRSIIEKEKKVLKYWKLLGGSEKNEGRKESET